MRLAAVILGLLASLFAGHAALGGEENGPGWKATLAPADEPGERLVVTGRVLDETGRPVAGALVYAYHTDIHGNYNEHGRDSSNPRLHGTVRTSDEGRYELDTIKPGPYPQGGIAAHIHVEITDEGLATRRFDFLFEGDPYISDGQRRQGAQPLGRAIILNPMSGEGETLRSEQDIVVRRK